MTYNVFGGTLNPTTTTTVVYSLVIKTGLYNAYVVSESEVHTSAAGAGGLHNVKINASVKVFFSGSYKDHFTSATTF